jgi:class 3 adenylate cyclase
VANRLGDGIVAVFGAPISIEDHAIRACRAAIEMRDRMAHSPPRFGTATDTPSAAMPVSLRIGLHSGEVVLRGTGVAVELAPGPVLHVASRLENSATPGTVRASAETVALTGGLVVESELYRDRFLSELRACGVTPGPVGLVDDPVVGAVVLARKLLS